ncbi:MAG: thrombospondin type 3 repeat-containing protein, partial [Solirubrobacterales bacterium]
MKATTNNYARNPFIRAVVGTIALVVASLTLVSTASAQQELSVGPAQIVEGNAGQTNMVFTIESAEGTAGDLSIDYQTSNGTASAQAGDYTASSGTAVIPSSCRDQEMCHFAGIPDYAYVSVPVNGDLDVEANETFSVIFSFTNPAPGGVNGGVSESGSVWTFNGADSAEAIGTIINDDAPPPDGDGDGVPDSTDDCPTQAGPASNNGCPVVQPGDGDGDGVPDSTDDCPTLAGP